MDSGDDFEGFILGNKFQVGANIGNGSFGQIHLAKNLKTGEDLAVKLEQVTTTRTKHQSRKRQDAVESEADTNEDLRPEENINEVNQKSSKPFHSQLKREAKIYYKLDQEGGIPRVRWLGLGDQMNFLVMDLLGRSLEDLFNFCGRKFTLKTVLVVACELISRIETVHSRGKLVHRDVKPENFLLGRGRDRHTIFIIDFGLAKLFENPHTGMHIPLKEGYSLTGTARYASVNAHHGYELSRRDDMFSIGYLLVYFFKGSLPWQGLHGISAEEKYRLICEKKETLTYEELCSDMPEEFLKYFQHVASLGFQDVPNYAMLRNLFKDLFVAKDFTYDNLLYDWEILAYQQQQEQQRQHQNHHPRRR